MDEALELALVGFASYRAAESLVSDEIPFGPARRALHRRYPPVKMRAGGGPDLDLHGKPMIDSRLGFLFTCVSCMSVWTTAAALLLHRRFPRATRAVAVAGLARYLGSR